MISIVNRTVFTTATTTGPVTVTIPATTAGNTLLVVMMKPSIQSAGAPRLGGVALGLPHGQWGSSIAVLENIAGGQTQLTWTNGFVVPSAAIIYELSPCTRIELAAIPGSYSPSNGQLNGTPSNSETGVTIIPGGGSNFAYFEVIAQDTTGGNYTSVNGPWVLDYATGSFLQGSGMGSVVYILNSTGTQTPTWSLTGGSTHMGVCAIAFFDLNPTPPGPPSGLGCTVSAGGSALSTYISDLGLNVAPATELYKSFVPTGNVNVSEYTSEGRTAIVLDFNAGDGLYSRDIETAFTWSVQNRLALRIWEPSLIPMPEQQYNRPTDWDDGGTPGNKFIQGITVEADSFNSAKTFQLQSADDLSLHALNEMPATFPKQTIKSFSCVTPFLAHSARIVSTDQVAWRVWKSSITFEPWPSQATNWQAEQVSFGMTGWLHAREMNIAYASANPITVVLVPDNGPTVTLTLPSSGGAVIQAKTKLTLPPMKFKLLSVQVVSTAPFYLFEGDLELKIKQWGTNEPYQVLKVVGGPSKTGAQV